ncbi:MAG: VWA domain-containing protein [Planctomycetota bacterium]|nr:MAG: VWA domain-containing protein [Planctomycetota bacterium]REJ94220.1 MAG: VWA domain-containing protein [Planctomycetota bacterium]REK20201.1 MAG: VWA domain-containing protein [Planctomycetota bacterium]REK35346.1 MAG: VWA domain-containing protein [Planctomycetota bacterium]
MFGRNVPALVISLAVHLVLLGMAAAFKIASTQEPEAVLVETVFNEDRVQEEFSQEMEIDTTVSQTLSLTSGGVVSENLGAAAESPMARTKIDRSQIVTDPTVRVPTIGDIETPGLGKLETDLGVGQVSGDVGARVEGYGAAMHRLTQELRRMMRQQPVIAVWLFDASNSLKDDREEIKENFNKVYEELELVRREADLKNERYSALETMICSFGASVKKLTPAPTAKLEEIKVAIDLVKDDPTGAENVFASISAVIEEYGVPSQRSRRQLAIIVVSDESGDDEDQLEEAVSLANKYKSPVYFLGREAILGYPYAHVGWTDPETMLHHWIRIRRGPETAYPECLQFDGFGGRYDATSSGFGPYGQVRLVKESGGIYFMLQREEENLLGIEARSPRKFDDIAMKEYEPNLVNRKAYVQERERSEFRKTIAQVIQVLDPHEHPELGIRRLHYPIAPEDFQQEGQRQFDRAVRTMQILNEAVERLERIKPERDLEADQRWRAAYDLMYAQCLSYRVRLFQFLLALDRHAETDPNPAQPKDNEWNVVHVSELLEPSEKQIKATKVDLAEIEAQRAKAQEMYQFCAEQHPDTPWEQRANRELSWGYGITFVSNFRDPRYDDPKYRDRIPNF